jgi:hypothetical protein
MHIQRQKSTDPEPLTHVPGMLVVQTLGLDYKVSTKKKLVGCVTGESAHHGDFDGYWNALAHLVHNAGLENSPLNTSPDLALRGKPQDILLQYVESKVPER